MRKLALALTISAALATVFAPAANANTVGIPGFNCSVTAYTPTGGGGAVSASGGVSCGGSQYNLAKQINVQLWQLVSGGWQQVTGTGWSGWSAANPFRESVGFDPCVHGRWYASVAYGNVMSGSTEAGAEATSFNAGWQCP